MRANRLAPDEAPGLIESGLRFRVQEMTVDIVRAAIASSQRFQLFYWDAAVIEAARTLCCKQVLSEDLNAGQSYAGVRVVNPFAANVTAFEFITASAHSRKPKLLPRIRVHPRLRPCLIRQFR